MNFLKLTSISISFTYAGSPDVEVPKSARGRLIEPILDPAIIDSMDVVTRGHLVRQGPIDESYDHLSFSLAGGAWPLQVATPGGLFNLNMTTRAIRAPGSVSFSVVSQPDLQVKFVHDCKIEGIDAYKSIPHPALREYWFGSTAQGVGPNYHFVSPPMPFPSRQMFADVASPENIRACQVAGAGVRFILMRRPKGTDLRTHLAAKPGQRYDPVFAFMVGSKLVTAVTELHSRGISHGNLRLEDIFISFDPTGKYFALTLNGFASSRVSWIDKRTGQSLQRSVIQPAPEHAYYRSPWEIMDGPLHRYTIRDDMYRAIQIVTTMVNGLANVANLAEIAREGRSLADYKLATPVLHVSTSVNPFRCLPISSEIKTKLMSLMLQLSAKVFDMKSVGHDDIKTKLDSLAAFAKRRSMERVLGRPLACDDEGEIAGAGAASHEPAAVRRVDPVSSAQAVAPASGPVGSSTGSSLRPSSLKRTRSDIGTVSSSPKGEEPEEEGVTAARALPPNKAARRTVSFAEEEEEGEEE